MSTPNPPDQPDPSQQYPPQQYPPQQMPPDVRPPGYGPPTGPPTGPQPTMQPPTESTEPAASAGTPYGFDDKGRVQLTKISGVWIGLIAAAVVLILLIIFIGQNLNTVGLHFLGFYGKVSLGLALLVAAICGVLIAAVPGTVRILQLRKSLRRNADPDTKQS